MKKIGLFFVFYFLILFSVQGQYIGGGGEANPNLKTNLQSLKKWQEMKFGLFIHWGPVSLRGTEIGWSRGREIPIQEYDNLYKEFNPVLFDAKEWVGIAKTAGMKYIVVTSKHHDGFCIWDSDYTDYDIMSTPFKRDILRELSDECKRQGIMFCTYHSICDWFHPHYTTRYGGDPRPVEESDMSLYIPYLKNQVKELIEKYDTNILWFDGEWESSWDHEKGMDLYKYVRELKDDVLINNRVDKGRRGMKGMTKSSKFAGDFGTPEQEIGAFHPNIPWESCITICRQWAWKPNDQMKSLRECIQTLARTVGGGGNLLLNVGPMLDGRIEQRQIDRLKEIGSWLEKNGDAIYAAKAGPFKPTDWMVSTYKKNQIFVHLFGWPEKELVLPGLKKHKIRAVKILDGASLTFKQTKKKIVLKLPEKPVDENNTVIILELDNDAKTIKPMDVPHNVLKGTTGSNIKLKFMFSQKYRANGVESLVDNIRGSQNFSDGNWLGFEENDFVAEVDLGSFKTIKKIGLGCLQNQDSWIFFPKSVEISVSKNGKKFEPVGKIETKAEQENSAVKKAAFTILVKSKKAQYVRLIAKNVGKCPDWHKGAGGKAWLFVDEIIIN